jgi:hypothetical protein
LLTKCEKIQQTQTYIFRYSTSHHLATIVKPHDLFMILKNPATWLSFVSKTPNYFGEIAVNMMGGPLTSLYQNEIILKSTHTVLEGPINVICCNIYVIWCHTTMTGYVSTFILWIGLGGIWLGLNPVPT